MLIRLLSLICLLLLIFGVIAYASGWISISPNQDGTTIELKTGEMKDAASKAVDKTKDLLD